MNKALQDLQQNFVNNLIAKVPDPVFLYCLQTQRLSTLRSFEIYRHHRYAKLLNALITTYPVCQRLVGEKFFNMLVDPYVQQSVSASPSLNDYGATLAAVLGDSPYLVDLPYLIDVMRLEWYIHTILTGSETPFFDWNTLSFVAPDQYPHLIFHRPVNSALCYSSFPIDRIWETNQINFIGEDRVDLKEGAVYLFVRRVGFEISIVRITAVMYTILMAIDGKQTLSQLQTVLTDKIEEQAIIKHLPMLIKAGYITQFTQ